MATIKTIQIAPYRKDCKVDGNKVIGTMDGRTFVAEIPDNYTIPKALEETMIKHFCEAIALSSKAWLVRDLLSDVWGVNVRFYELKKN